MDILLVVLGEAQAMTQFKSTSRTKVKRSHSCAQLKTDHFSGSKTIKKLDKTNIKYSITPNFPYNL